MITKATLRTATQTTGHAGSAQVVTRSHDEIASLAYELYLRSGRTGGRNEEHWLEAEHELRRDECNALLEADTSNGQSQEQRYSELLNGKNPRGDAKLMAAIRKANTSAGKRSRASVNAYGPVQPR